MSIDSLRARLGSALAAPLVALLVAAGGGCGGPAATDDRAPPARLAGREPLAQARAIAAADRPLRRLLEGAGSGFTAEGESLVANARGAGAGPARPRAEALHARTGASATGRLEVTPGELRRLRLSFEPEGARDAPAELVEGRALYREAYPSTDLLVATSAQRVETLLLLRGPRSPSVYRWRVTQGAGLTAFRDEAPGGARVFFDAAGDPVVRVLAPFAIDARGERREAHARWAEGELTVALDVRGLSYPVLLDPAVESATWVLVPGAGGVARFGHSMVYDAARKVVVAYGGGDASNIDTLGDTSVYDGATWKHAAGTGPTPRLGSAMAYDSKRQRTVLFGGLGPKTTQSFYDNQTWEWDGASWAPISAAMFPPARYDSAMAYDPKLGAAVLFGGRGGQSTDVPLADTWTFDGVAWTASAATASAATYQHAMTYDAARDRVTRTGGLATLGSSVVSLLDTFEWNGTGNWMLVSSSGEAAYGAAEVYDSGNQQTVLFLGADAAVVEGDAWTWDGTAWTERLTTGPSARYRAAMAYDIGRRRVVLQGGTDGQGKAVYADTWEYHARGGGCSDASGCDTGHCVDGVCCETAGCGACQSCNLATPGQCSAVTGMADPDSCAGASTCDAQGACKLSAGQPCKAGPDCASSFCVSGVCCASACGGACDVCAAAAGAPKNGVCGFAPAGFAGSCGPYVCPGNSDACTPGCSSDAGCAPGFYCGAGGACTAQRAPAAACNDAAGADCLTKGCRVCAEGAGRCADGFCCSAPCGGACDVCAAALGAAADGTCGPAPAGSPGSPSCAPYLCPGKGAACASGCAKDSDCAAGNFCRDGTCHQDEGVGKPCTSPSQCAAALVCVDGVCCNSPCNGKCQACAAALKASGKEDGICGFAVAGKNPHKDCLDEGAPVCGHDGSCDGQGECGVYAAGTVCKATGCVGSAASGYSATGFACTGSGACQPAAAMNCGLYVCAGVACKAACASSADCLPAAHCAAGACVVRRTNGQPCASADACTSGLCVDGLCCDAACQGQCEACNVVGTEGTCVPVGDMPHGARAACAAAPAGSPCAQTHCDGVSRASCEAFIGPSQVCREASCQDGAAVLSARCDGKGACPAEQTRLCEPFLCSGSACAQAPCARDADCAAKFRCDLQKHDCLPKEAASCDGDHTVTSPAGARTDCSPFKCEGTSCKTACAQIADCAAPSVCDASGKCVSPVAPADSTNSGGCGCRAAGERPGHRGRPTWLSALTLGLLGALGARRRRQRGARR